MSATGVEELVLGVEIEGAIGGDGYHVMRAVRNAIRSMAVTQLCYAEVGIELKSKNFPAVCVKIRGVEEARPQDLQQLAQKIGEAVNQATPATIVVCLVFHGATVVAHWSSHQD